MPCLCHNKYFRPFGTRRTHILELNEIPQLYQTYRPYVKEVEALVKDDHDPLVKNDPDLQQDEEDNAMADQPPCYQELFLNPAMLATEDLPTYSQVLRGCHQEQDQD